MRPKMIVASGLLSSAVAGGAAAQSLVIDDFSTGAYEVVLRGVDGDRNVQTASVPGGFRHTHFLSAYNPHHRPALLEISEGMLLAESGVGGFDRLEITYGVDESGQGAPLNLDLSAYDRFRLSFVASDLGHNINIAVFSAGTVSVHGFNTLSYPAPQDLDFAFASFKGADFTDVDHIVVVIQDGNATGGSDLALTGFTALRP